MALILNIETATRNCSVALAKGKDLIAVREIAEQQYTHAEKLHVLIEELFLEAGYKVSDLEAVAVSKGPGSYTGLRIGVSTAKGLAYALNIPLIALDTLKVMAAAIKVERGYIIPMIDARRMEVYSAVFDNGFNVIRKAEAEILNEDLYKDLDGPIWIAGDCQQKVKSVLKGSDVHFVENIIYPSARNMVSFSSEAYHEKAWEDVAYFEPFYLKNFMAG